MKLVYSKKELIDLINIVAISSLFCRAITGNDIYLYIGIVLGSILFASQLMVGNRIPFIAISSIIVVVFSYVFTFINNGFEHGMLFIVLFVSSAGIAWRIATDGISYKFCLFVFYGSLVYFFLMFYVFDISLWSLFAYSRNHISVYFINSACLLYVAAYLQERKISIIPALATFTVSVISVGMGGIISSGILFGLILYYKVSDRIWMNKIFMIVLIGLVFLLCLMHWGEMVTYLISSFNIKGDLSVKLENIHNLNESVRYMIWSDYISRLDFMRLMTGVYLGEQFHNYSNLHSSYFLLHARMGVFSIVLFILFLSVLIWLYKINFLLASCYFVILFRGLTDTTFMAGSSFDFVLLFFFLFGVSSVRNKYSQSRIAPL